MEAIQIFQELIGTRITPIEFRYQPYIDTFATYPYHHSTDPSFEAEFVDLMFDSVVFYAYEKEEIEKAMEVYKTNDCVVVSDEIWSDLILPGAKHIPTQTVSDDAKQRTIAIYAPSKTFNLAGLIGSYHIIYNKYLRDKVQREGAITHYNSMNVLSMHALLGAYGKEGQEWVDELREVLFSNVDYAYEFIVKNFEGVSLAKPQGTYMLYLDCTKWCKMHETSIDDLLVAGASVGVIWQDGRPFGFPNTIRMDLAVPHSLVIEAMNRLKEYVF